MICIGFIVKFADKRLLFGVVLQNGISCKVVKTVKMLKKEVILMFILRLIELCNTKFINRLR